MFLVGIGAEKYKLRKECTMFLGERGAEKVQLQIRMYHVSKGKPCSYIGERGVTKSVPCSYRRKRSRDQTRQEYDLLARLRHNNIVGVSGLFSTPSSDAIVMDL